MELDVFLAEFTMFTAALFAVSRTVFETDAAASVADFATEAVVSRMLLVIGTALLAIDWTLLASPFPRFPTSPPSPLTIPETDPLSWSLSAVILEMPMSFAAEPYADAINWDVFASTESSIARMFATFLLSCEPPSSLYPDAI